MIDRDLYVFKEYLYRFGNSTCPKLTHIRKGKEADIFLKDNVLFVRASNKGISVFTKQGLDKSRLTGYVWEIPKGTLLPSGLKLYNDRSEHYTIAPTHNMSVSEYQRLLESLSYKCQKSFKKG